MSLKIPSLLRGMVQGKRKKCIVLVTKEGSTKIVNFMTLRLGIVILLSYTTVDIYLFFDGAVDIQI